MPSAFPVGTKSEAGSQLASSLHFPAFLAKLTSAEGMAPHSVLRLQEAICFLHSHSFLEGQNTKGWDPAGTAQKMLHTMAEPSPNPNSD